MLARRYITFLFILPLNEHLLEEFDVSDLLTADFLLEDPLSSCLILLLRRDHIAIGQSFSSCIF